MISNVTNSIKINLYTHLKSNSSVITTLALSALGVVVAHSYTSVFTARILSACMLGLAIRTIYKSKTVPTQTNQIASAQPQQLSTPVMQPKNVSSPKPAVIKAIYPLPLFQHIIHALNGNPDISPAEIIDIRDELNAGNFTPFKKYLLKIKDKDYTKLKDVSFFKWAFPILEQGINNFTNVECAQLHQNFCKANLFNSVPESGFPDNLPFLLGSPVYRAKQGFGGVESSDAKYDRKHVASYMHTGKVAYQNLEELVNVFNSLNFWLGKGAHQFFIEKEIDCALRADNNLEINARWDKCVRLTKELLDEEMTETVLARFLMINGGSRFFEKENLYQCSLENVHLLGGQGSFYNYLSQYVNALYVNETDSPDLIQNLKTLKKENRPIFNQIQTITFKNVGPRVVEKVYRILDPVKVVNLKFGRKGQEREFHLESYLWIFGKAPGGLRNWAADQVTINVYTKAKCYFYTSLNAWWDAAKPTFHDPQNISLVVNEIPAELLQSFKPYIGGFKPHRAKFRHSDCADWVKKFTRNGYIYTY